MLAFFEKNMKNDFSLTVLVTMFGLVSGFCSILGFWSYIDFDIFPFLSTVDILKSSFTPSILLIAVIIFNFLCAYFFSDDSFIAQEIHKRKDRFPIFFYIVSGSLHLLLLVLVIINYHGEVESKNMYIKAFPVVYCILILFSFKASLDIRILPEYNIVLRSVLIYFLIVFPAISFENGMAHAKSILKKEFYYIVPGKGCTDTQLDNIYLGFYSDRLISLSVKDKVICLKKDENLQLIRKK
ncbi:hypothetical protein EXT69_14740 [Pantoea agglomerans]|jgi:hypothetical protein|uniref:hypothetical protein n=1 Tax=Enterobacter agglomerans TaxID=549 RepID=UPI00202D8149|nr:hypothetical protein [Pantoea agglomerans]MCL6412191.1 hypothetical protein [Pantoea agglomerans]